MKKIFSVLVVAFFLAATFVLVPQSNYFALAEDEDGVTDADAAIDSDNDGAADGNNESNGVDLNRLDRERSTAALVNTLPEHLFCTSNTDCRFNRINIICIQGHCNPLMCNLCLDRRAYCPDPCPTGRVCQGNICILPPPLPLPAGSFVCPIGRCLNLPSGICVLSCPPPRSCGTGRVCR